LGRGVGLDIEPAASRDPQLAARIAHQEEHRFIAGRERLRAWHLHEQLADAAARNHHRGRAGAVTLVRLVN
jgi:hypothetical protein